ncbi:serine/threonine-protein kinase [Actinoalloteichus hymeniacidonis]|uniref:non-specific serine/threonine protein kinase n=1 Tax=Actinoalloteichus hymeniacidonis TaxID=340345 RepID=A0AAC9MZC5_9PSEU|nr:serine/threonine-protein kinase [Actinoalloteichus hymeniacidonis]AOS64215.1 protein kinase family protein [Actinoalloteichus hymeniacidonis]MBB5907717.1 hypothetical protein [Actinoalloteichus hymeniacidonis]
MDQEGQLVAGRYRLLDQIGSGAMGVVWKAQDERLGRVVAVKQLLLQPGLTPAAANEARERAFREGRIAARLQHPHATSVYDVVEHDEQPCLVMEYFASRSLAAVLHQDGPLDIREAARIGTQVASALHAAHVAGVVHRDVKPANVLLGEEGIVKIADFGISRAAGDVAVTQTGMLAGTPAYLAPEVAKGKPSLPASDVFSLGSTLYAAVEGGPPFGTSDNGLAILHAVAAGEFTPPEQAEELTPVLLRMLTLDPEQRMTMPEVQRVLSEVATGGTATGLTPLYDEDDLDEDPTVLAPGAAATTRAARPQTTTIAARPAGAMPTATAARARPAPAPAPQAFWRRPAVLAGVSVLGVALVAVVITALLNGNQPPDSQQTPADQPASEQDRGPTPTEAATTTDEVPDPGYQQDHGNQPVPPPNHGGPGATGQPEPEPSDTASTTEDEGETETSTSSAETEPSVPTDIEDPPETDPTGDDPPPDEDDDQVEDPPTGGMSG